MLPRLAVLAAAVAGVAGYWPAGLGSTAALSLALAAFVLLGGGRYLLFLSRVLPRDVK